MENTGSYKLADISRFMFTTKLKVKSFVSLLLLTGVASFGFQQSGKAQNTAFSKILETESFLQQTADTMNQRLPMMVDNDTQWDSSSAGPGKSLNYNYTLVNYSASQIDGYVFAKNARVLLTEKVCNEPSVVIFPKEGVLLNFNYFDNTRNLIARVKVEPSDCGY